MFNCIATALGAGGAEMPDRIFAHAVNLTSVGHLGNQHMLTITQSHRQKLDDIWQRFLDISVRISLWIQNDIVDFDVNRIKTHARSGNISDDHCKLCGGSGKNGEFTCGVCNGTGKKE
jgi:hypothetical protein